MGLNNLKQMANKQSEEALKGFHTELKALLEKYGIALDIKAELVAAYVGKPNQAPTPSPISLDS